MPTLDVIQFDESCPECIGRGDNSTLVRVTETWNPDPDEDIMHFAVVYTHCNVCGYENVLLTENENFGKPGDIRHNERYLEINSSPLAACF